MLKKRIEEISSSLFPKMVCDRRYLHENPYPTFHDEETGRYLASILEKEGIPFRYPVGKCGIVARIKGEKEGPTIAFRADFDALEVIEKTNLPFSSKNPGVMHACGHDSHTAILLSLARAFHQNRDLVSGEVVFIFQYSEEIPPGGAQFMIEDGCLNGIDKIYALHVTDELETGVIGAAPGPYMAASDKFTIEFLGPGGHGANPSQTNDTVTAACTAVTMINTIISRNVNPFRPAIISVCEIHGGTLFNVIPAKMTVIGTVRSYSAESAAFIKEKIELASKAAAGMYGVSANVRYDFGYPVTVNTEKETATVFEACKKFGKYPCRKIDPSTVAEDFSYYLQKIPGCLFRLGIKNPDKNAVYPLHNDQFTIDEDAMKVALETFLAIYLTETGQL